MISTPMKQGFLPSSTPVQVLNDSGYFGSVNKSSLTKTAHKLSPIKEFSPFKKRANDLSELLNFDFSTKEDCDSTSNLKEFQFPFDEPVKELDFNDTSLSLCNSYADESSKDAESVNQNSFPSFLIHDLEDKIPLSNQKVIHHLQRDKDISLHLSIVNDPKNKEQFYANKDSSNSIHSEVSQKYDTLRRIKYIKLDILRELEKINCTSTLKHIFTFLSAADLTKVCCVSKKWREIVIRDVKANSKRKKFLKDIQDHKENQQHLSTILKINNKGEARRPVSLYKTVLTDINNIKVSPKQPLANQNRKFDSFIEEGKKLKDGILRKCPKCEFAAKSQNNDKYSCTNCFYAFCGNCLNPVIARNHSCSKQTVSIIIGSKKSKKNLKRL